MKTKPNTDAGKLVKINSYEQGGLVSIKICTSGSSDYSKGKSMEKEEPEEEEDEEEED